MIYNLWSYKIKIKENKDFQQSSCEFSFGHSGK